MTLQTDAPLVHRSLHASNRQAREVARMVSDGLLDVAPAYQRPSVWTRTQQINLVRSWLLGIPVPAIMINDRGTEAWRRANGSSPLDSGEACYAAVDGRQRLEAAAAWFSGALAVPASWFDPAVVETVTETDDGPYVTFTGLTLVGQRLMSNRAMLPAIEANANTVAEEADLYMLVNTGGTHQTEADLDHAAAYGTSL
jgi:hypothetical protein